MDFILRSERKVSFDKKFIADGKKSVSTLLEDLPFDILKNLYG